MKAINKACQFLAIILAVATLALFFVVPFVTIVTADGAESFVGAELAFGGGALYKSTKILFCFFLTIVAGVLSAATLKNNGARFAAPVVALGDAIFLLVIALGSEGMFVDYRPFTISGIEYTWAPLAVSLVMFGAFVISAAHLFINDLIEVREGKRKYTLIQRFIQLLRDYKSEIKKIVWPGLREVIKNTVVVLVISLMVGAFIWLVDWGLGTLMKLIGGA